MSTPTQEQIFADFLANTGRAGRLRRKLAANRYRNWALALTLHSFARFAQQARLSDLEAGIIKGFKQHGYDDAELIRYGEFALKLNAAVRAELFEPEYAGLPSDTPYTLAQLAADVPQLVKTTLAQPNTTVIDVEGIHAGRSKLSDFRQPSEQVLSAARVVPDRGHRTGGSGGGQDFLGGHHDQGDQVPLQPPRDRRRVQAEVRVLLHLRHDRGGLDEHHEEHGVRGRRHGRHAHLQQHRRQHVGTGRPPRAPPCR
jgi:hypothetical protein